MSDLDRISFLRDWIRQIRDRLEGPLPYGKLGDWAFLFRDQLTDALARADDPLLAELTTVRKQLVQAREALDNLNIHAFQVDHNMVIPKIEWDAALTSALGTEK